MLGIVVLNYNTCEDTIECVQSIVETTKNKFKIYIVDNKSSDSSFEILSEKFKCNSLIEIIKSEINGGYSAGNNLGIKKALEEGADAVLLSNSDIIYYDNSIDAMYLTIHNNSDVGIVGPKVLLLNGEIQHFVRENYTFANYMFSKNPLKKLDVFNINYRVYNKNYNYYDELFYFGLVSGCCIMLSKNYFNSCGILDDNIFLYFEEAIISYKAKQQGLLTCLNPKAVVLHKSSGSIGNKASAFSRYHRYFSSLYFLKKYLKINNFKLSLSLIINLVPLIFNSVNDKSYRIYMMELIKNSKVLFNLK